MNEERQALKTLDALIKSLQNLKENFQHEEFDYFLNQILSIPVKKGGRVVITGVGKSAHIGKKISATLASTGVPSIFLDPTHASHGDLGKLVFDRDLVIGITNSGESIEMILPCKVMEKMKIPFFTICNKPKSTIGKYSEQNLKLFVDKDEACPLGLAPMASTMVTLALGDMISAELMVKQGFSREDFALSHPGGALGRNLLFKVSDLMLSENDFPTVTNNNTLMETLEVMNKKNTGCAVVLHPDGGLAGFISDGDIRRALTSHGVEAMVHDINKTPNPLTIHFDEFAKAALNKANAGVNGKAVGDLVVVDDNNKPIGVISAKRLTSELL